MPTSNPGPGPAVPAASTETHGNTPSETAIARTLARHPRPLGGDPMRNFRPAVSLSSMVLNNRTDGTHQLAQKRKPAWLRARVPGGGAYANLKKNIDENRLFTVCEEAACPNMGECWARGVATIMILGDTCTRSCGFCNVKSGRPPVLDTDEPRRVAESLRLMDLKHVVITSVNRDELPDGGAGIWAETIKRSHDACPDLSIEVLIPDFMGDWDALQKVIDARPNIIAHNLECVPRMYPAVRPSAKYDRSLEMLRRIKQQGVVAKTSFMVGIGERDSELIDAFDELVAYTADHDGPRDPRPEEAGGTGLGDPCDIVTVGQYLQPTRNHLPVARWVHPDDFAMYEREGLQRGIKVVMSGPMVRSSYLADAAADRLSAAGVDEALKLAERTRGRSEGAAYDGPTEHRR